MADLRLSKLTKSYPLSGNERIPISQANIESDNQPITLYMSPSSLNAYINNNIVPVGTIWPYAGVVNLTNKPLPVGWLFCDGAELLINSYIQLYNTIKNIYGSASAADKFKLPDMRCRFVMGYNDITPTYKPTFGNFFGTSLKLGQLSGEFTHSLSLNEMLSHKHECSLTRSYIPLLTHPGSEVEQYQEDSGSRSYSANILPILDLMSTNIGGNMPHNTTPPYVAMHYIIKY